MKKLFVKYLTPMEEGLLPLMLQGLDHKQIAVVANITVRTVKFHTSNIWHKLKVSGKDEFLSKYGRFEVSLKWVPYGD